AARTRSCESSLQTEVARFLYGLTEAYRGRDDHPATLSRAVRRITRWTGVATAGAVPGWPGRGGGRRSARAQHLLLRLVRGRGMGNHLPGGGLAPRQRWLLQGPL